ncbi:class I SAM-dependent methyltransferase [Bacillus sp. S/N-304-OC-R1]|uniref:class I SAM-dependent methyltransferase n=1 Tax=Bacillus sp. S/N-304-OC-R1 TaxID=2758034 RepID=UPI001C8DEEC6|nr:class I SAM-dependent methyltransferase [Bacillus sp. S/N-304-OC-R1]MBY0122005.1 methyltransferase domain-containing protein [Bacillus sp. S/N-304-OC-R1]
MLNNLGFNLWADHYDKTVQISEENNLYPFAGYMEILNTIFNEVMQIKNSNVLDIGFGTGVLTSKLYENGHNIDGIDFSSKMISIAKMKMPSANLLEWDITNGVPPEFQQYQYDSIVSTYALHHLTDKDKVLFIRNLLSLIKEDGKIFIGDISFETREQLEECRQESKDYWDHDEYYFVSNEIKAALKDDCHCEYYPISHCGGVFVLSKKS